MTTPRCAHPRHVYPRVINRGVQYPHIVVCQCGQQQRVATLFGRNKRVAVTYRPMVH